ncbi:hypothetical protein [Aurantiacibacter flavus]|uniref:Glycosyltransferase n=1 Tax=Aurantiacibacter flavus TaxID=3145232 RepID=A0ABV0D377_9SPHN
MSGNSTPRGRSNDETARHAAANPAILETPPIAPHGESLVLFTEIGNAQLLRCLVAIKSLHAQLGRGRVALLDDGTLTGADRAVLAHHCGDPEIIAPADTGPGWRALETLLKRRGSAYWLWLSGDSVTIGPVPEIEQAIAINASFLLPLEGSANHPEPLSDFARAAFPDGPVSGEVMARLESRLARIDRPGWRYVQSDAGLMGFAAGGPGIRFAAACRAELEELIGADDVNGPEAAQVAASLLLASESRTVLLPQERYRHGGATGWNDGTSFLHFSGGDRHAGEHYAQASQIAIEALRSR